MFGYLVFGDVPGMSTVAGAAIVSFGRPSAHLMIIIEVKSDHVYSSKFRLIGFSG
jgi:hypothetical protein